jgi:hypothetical protein
LDVPSGCFRAMHWEVRFLRVAETALPILGSSFVEARQASWATWPCFDDFSPNTTAATPATITNPKRGVCNFPQKTLLLLVQQY